MRRSRTIVLVLALVLSLTAMGAVFAQGPSDNSYYGRCTAYFAGSDNGRENKRNAPPFQDLADDAEDAGADDVADFCAGVVNPGGKPWSPAPGQNR